ncbi:MAG: 2-methylcitrate dehydratase, partial [Caulobacteraceae bacterium]
SIPNALTVEFTDGTRLDELVVEYPIGHKRRREDGIPLLEAKFRTNLARRFPEAQQRAILDVSLDQARLEAMSVPDYVDLYVA